MSFEVLTNAQMTEADRLTIAGGTPGYALMQAAGRAVAGVVAKYYPGQPVCVLCGPGNNGGDGYVAARLLKEAGFDVSAWSFVPPETLTGDARRAWEDWKGDWGEPVKNAVIIDALFGTGFNKKLEESIVSIFNQIKKQNLKIVAVDVPSGVNGDDGSADPHTLKADHTVTFFRKKLGHVLMPGLDLCGEVSVHDIGIPDFVLEKTGFAALENDPALWAEKLPRPGAGAHKFSRGHLVVLGGSRMTGAARLVSEAAMRMGAGLCTIVADPKVAEVYQKGAPHVMFEPLADLRNFAAHLSDPRRSAAVIGPGAGLDDEARKEALRFAISNCIMKNKKPVVLDADALSVFAENTTELFNVSRETLVLTPHDGEFKRLFPDLFGSKLERAKAAASKSGALVLYKGPDTVIAAPDGRAVVNIHAAPFLATAGAGDVLAGMIGGLLAEGMEAFDAACAASWIHGEVALRHGPGLVAPDIVEGIPSIIRNLYFA